MWLNCFVNHKEVDISLQDITKIHPYLTTSVTIKEPLCINIHSNSPFRFFRSRHSLKLPMLQVGFCFQLPKNCFPPRTRSILRQVDKPTSKLSARKIASQTFPPTGT